MTKTLFRNIQHGTRIPPVLSEEVDDVKRRPVHQSDRQVKCRLPLFLEHIRNKRECQALQEEVTENPKLLFLVRVQKKATDVSVGQRDGLHEVDSLGEHLDQGEDVAGFDRVAQCV